jgi:putative heme-binding domain-containing protein
VRLFNRTDGDFAARLDGCVVRALDAERREVFVARGGAAGASLEFELGAGDAAPARAAARLLGTLGAERADTLERLIARFDVAALRPALVTALHAIPLARWPDAARQHMVAALHAALAAAPASDGEAWALAEELATSTKGEAARALLDLCQRARPKVVVLRPVVDSLRFDTREIAVLATRPIELTFANVDIMPHNFVLAAVGALAKVGLAGEAMAADPDATARHFVPELPEVLQATRLLQPGQSQTLEFRAPDVAGDYPFVCTFPGHWTRMNGVLHVAATPEELAALEARMAERSKDTAPSATPASAARSFVRDWQLADLAGDLARVRTASSSRGRALLEQASCLKCHADPESTAAGHAPRTGPALADAVRAHADARELLQSILEPSARIREGYTSELFFLKDGRTVAGRVMESEPGLLLVQDDPYRDDLLELPLADIDERRANQLSTMPSGLLSTFQRDEILDLLAYLEALRQ